jgi:cyclopropane fatty-acyl-phospholipid synthase-like methyltransferase
MADRWFEIATTDHFWIRRRFDVLQQIAGRSIAEAQAVAEIGCGNGLLQRQIEEVYAREVSGFDLNESALWCNVSRRSEISCYDIHQKLSSLRERFDLIFLFDVLEHISDERSFMESLMFHLAPGGRVVVNVPAGQWAYSEYDRAAGHVRRYSIATLKQAVHRNSMEVADWTYWGLPLVPTLLLRRLWLWGRRDADEIISSGFDSRTQLINQTLKFLSALEPIPQRFLGTSLMAVLEVKG